MICMMLYFYYMLRDFMEIMLMTKLMEIASSTIVVYLFIYFFCFLFLIYIYIYIYLNPLLKSGVFLNALQLLYDNFLNKIK